MSVFTFVALVLDELECLAAELLDSVDERYKLDAEAVWLAHALVSRIALREGLLPALWPAR